MKTDREGEKEKLEGTKREADRHAESEEKVERLSASQTLCTWEREKGRQEGQKQEETEPSRERAREGDTEEDRQQGIGWRLGDCDLG